MKILSDTIIDNMLVEVHYPNSFGHIQNPDSDVDILIDKILNKLKHNYNIIQR